MSSEKPHFLARKFQDFQRQSARPFTCPLCNDNSTYASVARLKEHAASLHAEVDRDPDSEAWRAFLSEANKTRTKTIRTAAPEPPIEPSRKSSSDGDSLRPNPDENRSLSQSTHSRPLSVQVPQGYTESFDKLSINQDNSPPIGPQLSPAAPSNPLKRASGETGSQSRPADPSSYTSPRSRRAKVQSNEYARRAPGNKRLFNPNSDGPYRSSSHVKASPNDGSLLASAGQLNEDPEARGHSSPTGADAHYSRSNLKSEQTSTAPQISSGLKDSRHDDEVEFDPEPELLLQPETRPISHEQLVVEVKGIYAGLVMVEAKCIDVDDKQSVAAQERDPAKRTKLTSEQWSALIALHKTLLHEHHDFFLASQHPAASPALSKLAAKYSMPARMWRHGIHAFLEVLRHRLPESLDHMLAFIYIAYSMMALLYETVEAFQDTWIECLGDLGRYRMAIEDDDVRDREVWSGVARFWYAKAADRSPKVGRLYHHLAILARPFTIQQLSLYCRSLTCITPFESARSSIMTMFTPVLEGRESVFVRSNTTEVLFVHAHAILFTGRSPADYRRIVTQLTNGNQFAKFIARAQTKFKEIGVSAALANLACLYDYGATNKQGIHTSVLRLRIEEEKHTRDTQTSPNVEATPSMPLQRVANLSTQEQVASLDAINNASEITFGTLAVALRQRNDNRNVLPMLHVYAVFIWYVASIERAMELVERWIPWAELVSFLNVITKPQSTTDKVRSTSFPGRRNGSKARPLPEDFVMRGLPHTESYFPSYWFEDTGMDDEERGLELPSFHAPRVDRILWAFYQVATYERWILFDEENCAFVETPYVRNLPTWEPSNSLEPVATQPDVAMADTDDRQEPVSSTAQSPSNDLLSNVPKQTHAEPEHTKSEPAVQAPKYILKRETRPPVKEDIIMRDTTDIKQEPSSPDATVNPTTEEWLNPSVKTHGLPRKIDPDALDSDPDKVRVFNVLDETKDPTMS